MYFNDINNEFVTFNVLNGYENITILLSHWEILTFMSVKTNYNITRVIMK